MVAIPTAVTAVAGMFCPLIPGLCSQPGVVDLSCATMPLSPDQLAALGPPTTPLSAVGLGFGVQNYTCSAESVFVSTGAVGEVFDISWLANGDGGLICTVHQDLFNFWNSSQPGSVTVQELIDALPSVVPPNTILDQHYFNDDGAGGITPVWDSRATPRFQGVDNAVFLGKVVAKTSDPNPTQNVDWLHLVKVSGDIADEVYRILTVGGVPPTSCVGGTTEDISIKYVSQYWLFGGSLGSG